jgi:hypothetical protein
MLGSDSTSGLSCRLSGPRVRIRLHPLVVLVQRRLEEEDGGDAARHRGDVARLVGRKVTPEQGALAVREPLLDYVVAADRVLPDAGGDAAPVGDVVEEDVVAGAAEAGSELVVGDTEAREALAEGGEFGVGVGALEGAAMTALVVGVGLLHLLPCIASLWPLIATLLTRQP